jgi:N-acetylglucosaminyl-diphospho-decaprenol L-rhamnosyltransferase
VDGTVPLVTAVLVSFNSSADLAESLPLLGDERVEVVVVDNASADNSAEVASRHGPVVGLPVNVGWARGCNIGAAMASADVLAFVNPDARPTAQQLVDLAADVPAATQAAGSLIAVSPRFVDPDGSTQPFYFRFPTVMSGMFCFLTAGQRVDALLGHRFLRRRTYDAGRELPGPVDQPGAACLLLGKDAFVAMDGFADDFFLFFADTDLCRRLRDRGGKVTVRWDVAVPHRGRGSVRALDDTTLQRLFQRDYLTYVRRTHGRAATWLTRLAVAVLTGLVPWLTRTVRGRVREGARQLAVAAAVLR